MKIQERLTEEMVLGVVLIFFLLVAGFLAYLTYLSYYGKDLLTTGVIGLVTLGVLVIWAGFLFTLVKSRLERKSQFEEQ